MDEEVTFISYIIISKMHIKISKKNESRKKCERRKKRTCCTTSSMYNMYNLYVVRTSNVYCKDTVGREQKEKQRHKKIVTMEASNAERQVEELLTLQEQWYNEAIHIKTPTLFHRLKRTIGKIKGIIDVKKQLRFEISCGVLCSSSSSSRMLDDLILDIEFPLDYPSENICQVKAISKTSGKEYISCTNQIQQYLHSFRGCECVEIILDWIEQNKNTCLIESSEDHNNSSNDNDLEGKIKCFVLRYNHLLSGPEHKKEKAMIDTAKKMKLQGGIQ